MKRPVQRANQESGFALLLVLVMAAAIAITLYMEVPRFAFESQRDREQMTIDRGHQYVRAIQLFYRKYQLYPQTLDDLETTRNVRFLRHRYVDPLTGKAYRLLHVGPAGQLTDSLVQPPAPLPGSSGGSGPSSSQTSSTSQTSASASTGQPAGQPVDPNNPNDPNAQSINPLDMAQKRPSDRIIGGSGGGPGGIGAGNSGGFPVEPPGDQPLPEPDPNQPQPVAGQPVPGQPVQPGDPNQTGQPPQPGQTGITGLPGIPGQSSPPPDQPVPPVQFPPGIAPPPGMNLPSGAVPNASPNPYPVPVNPGASQQSAASMIQNLLTTPRQPPSSIASAFTSGNTGGIAGVASTADGKGIHKVNDRTKYKEWEFVYDLKKDKTVVGAAAVNAQQNMQQQMQQNQNGSNSPFGTSTTSSPFSSGPAPAGSAGSAAAPTTPPPSPPSQ